MFLDRDTDALVRQFEFKKSDCIIGHELRCYRPAYKLRKLVRTHGNVLARLNGAKDVPAAFRLNGKNILSS